MLKKYRFYNKHSTEINIANVILKPHTSEIIETEITPHIMRLKSNGIITFFEVLENSTSLNIDEVTNTRRGRRKTSSEDEILEETKE